jgi:hypothetical protein
MIGLRHPQEGGDCQRNGQHERRKCQAPGDAGQHTAQDRQQDHGDPIDDDLVSLAVKLAVFGNEIADQHDGERAERAHSHALQGAQRQQPRIGRRQRGRAAREAEQRQAENQDEAAAAEIGEHAEQRRQHHGGRGEGRHHEADPGLVDPEVGGKNRQHRIEQRGAAADRDVCRKGERQRPPIARSADLRCRNRWLAKLELRIHGQLG